MKRMLELKKVRMVTCVCPQRAPSKQGELGGKFNAAGLERNFWDRAHKTHITKFTGKEDAIDETEKRGQLTQFVKKERHK